MRARWLLTGALIAVGLAVAWPVVVGFFVARPPSTIVGVPVGLVLFEVTAAVAAGSAGFVLTTWAARAQRRKALPLLAMAALTAVLGLLLLPVIAGLAGLVSNRCPNVALFADNDILGAATPTVEVADCIISAVRGMYWMEFLVMPFLFPILFAFLLVPAIAWFGAVRVVASGWEMPGEPWRWGADDSAADEPAAAEPTEDDSAAAPAPPLESSVSPDDAAEPGSRAP
jgi:hypothetical protein